MEIIVLIALLFLLYKEHTHNEQIRDLNLEIHEINKKQISYEDLKELIKKQENCIQEFDTKAQKIIELFEDERTV